MLEQETKFLVSDSFCMPDLSNVATDITAEPSEEQHYATVYWDTPDARLQRWNCTLRHRSGEGWTVKLPSTTSSDLLSRPELPFAGDDTAPPDAAVRLLRAYARDAPLAPTLHLSTVRRRIRLVTPTGLKAAEVVDDTVTVQDAGGDRRFREVEIELGPAATPTLLSVITRRLQAAGAGAPDLTSKLLRAQGGARPTPEVVVPELPRRPTPGVIAQRSLAGAIRQLLECDPLVRIGDDPEAVHQARVATRRLRADLRTFGSLLQAAWVTPLREELGWLGGELGAVRDAEVLSARLRERAKELPLDDRDAAAALFERADSEIGVRRERLLATLDTDRYLHLVERLIAAAREPAFTREAATGGKDRLGPLVVQPWRRLGRAIGQLGSEPPDTALHQVRIRAKRCRYAAEAVIPLLGKPARRFAEKATALQTVLGDLQDSVTADQWLRQAAQAGSAPFVAGELLMLEVAAQQRARGAWPAAWQALKKRDPRRW